MSLQTNQESFWRLLERRYTSLGVMLEWQNALGDALQHLQSRFLFPIDEFAKYYPNPCDPDGLFYDVIAYRDGTFEAISSTQDHCIPLQPEDVVFQRWNLPKFCNYVARCFSIEPTGDVIEMDDRLLRLGNYQISAGDEYPVYWLLACDRSEFQRDVSAMLLKIKTPFFLFTGTRSPWVPEMLNILQEKNVPLLPLCEALEFKDGQFVTTDVWHGAIESFRKTLHPENMVAAPPFEFRKKGQVWVVRYQGKETFLKDAVGPHYISLLLRKPHKPIFAVALHAIVAGQEPEKEVRVGTTEFVLDELAQAEIKDQLQVLLSEIDDAKNCGDHLVEQESQKEYDELLAFYQKNIGLGGQIRKEHDGAAKIRQAVQKAIQRTIILIEEELPECAAHLEQSISTGTKFNYSPDQSINWVL